MMGKLMTFLRFLDERLGEPSTYASLAIMFSLANVNVDPGVWKVATMYGGVAAAGLGFLLREASSGKTVAQIVSDTLAAIVAAANAKTPPPPAPPAA